MNEIVLYTPHVVDLGGGGCPSWRNKTEVACPSINMYCKAWLITMSWSQHYIKCKKKNKQTNSIKSWKYNIPLPIIHPFPPPPPPPPPPLFDLKMLWVTTHEHNLWRRICLGSQCLVQNHNCTAIYFFCTIICTIIKSVLYVWIAILTGNKHFWWHGTGRTWLIQSRLIELGVRRHTVLVHHISNHCCIWGSQCLQLVSVARNVTLAALD